MTTARKPLPRDAGLTLLELLVVVTILVLLSAAIGTVALNYLDRAKSDTAKLQINQISAGLDLFRLDIGRYPSEQEGLSVLVERSAGLDAWQGPYVQKAESLIDPWGAEFIYRASASEKPYDLISFGSDGLEGGEDDAADVTN